MLQSTDLYLGTFLILSGFSLSLLNITRIMQGRNMFTSMLLSENLILTSIGIAFVARATYKLNPLNINTFELEERSSEMVPSGNGVQCGFWTVIMSYGPLIVSLVNSFVSLIIDNYMHYKMIEETKKEDDENVVQEIVLESRRLSDTKVKIHGFWRKYFSFILIGLQWIIPILLALFMYPMDVKEMVMTRHIKSDIDSCMTLMDISNGTCMETASNYSLELRKYIPFKNYIQSYENVESKENSTEINSIIENVYRIIYNFTNFNVNVTSSPLYRKPKLYEKCVRICYMENKSMLSYMFIIAVVSFFVPITISTIILTKIQAMDIKRPNVKTYVSRELLYNVLFWSPVMFDTLLTLIFCSYSMNGMRTSLFNVIANVYQAVKNFINSKYFKDNIVAPA